MSADGDLQCLICSVQPDHFCTGITKIFTETASRIDVPPSPCPRPGNAGILVYLGTLN